MGFQKEKLETQKVIVVSGVDFAARIFTEFMQKNKNVTMAHVANNPLRYEKEIGVKIEVFTFAGSEVPLWFLNFVKRFIGDNPHTDFYVINTTF
jgi:hypothetical protein